MAMLVLSLMLTLLVIACVVGARLLLYRAKENNETLHRKADKPSSRDIDAALRGFEVRMPANFKFERDDANTR